MPNDQKTAEDAAAIEQVASDLREFLKEKFTGLKNTKETREQIRQATARYIEDQTGHLPDHLMPRLENVQVHSDGRSTATVVMPRPTKFLSQEYWIDMPALVDKPKDNVEIICREAEKDWGWDNG